MKKPSKKNFAIIAVLLLVVGLFQPFFGSASDQVSNGGIDIQMYLDYTQSGQFWNYTRGNSTTINAGDTVYIRENTTFSNPVRGTLGGQPNGTSVVHWVASNCLPGASCQQWIYRDQSNPLIFPWWVVVLGASYTGSSAAFLAVQTSQNTPAGTYTIDFTAEENPVTWPAPLMNPASQRFTIIVKPKTQPIISVNPSILSFQGVSGGSTPASQSVVLKNTGIDPLNWSESADTSWCHLSQASGKLLSNESITLQASVDAPSNVGSFNCSITLADPVASNSPKKIGVTYQVTAEPKAKMSLGPAQLSFFAYSNGQQPSPKSALLKNTGNADLNWQANTNLPWCHVSPTSGTLVPGNNQSLQVSVDAPSNVGTFNCVVTANDPAAENSPKSFSVNYQVKQFIGDPSSLVAVDKPCEAVSLAWQPASGAGQYNIYRNTRNTVPAVALVAGFSGTQYIDTAINAGTKYYYWVETLGGTLSTKVAAASNSAGGVEVKACAISEIPIEPPLVAVSSPACEKTGLQWTNVVNENGYNIYRNTTGASPNNSQKIGSVNANITTFNDSLGSGSYYYWVSSFNEKGESLRAPSSPIKISVSSCEADLSSSDKNIIKINGNPQQRTICDYNQFQGLPGGKTVLKPGDILTYEINLCNSAVKKDAKDVVVTDTLTNLELPSSGFKAKLDGDLMHQVQSSPKAGEFTYTASTRKLTLNIGKIKKASHHQLTYEVEVKTQAGYTSICPRCQNKAVITYGKDDDNTSTVELFSPEIFYSVNPNSVSN